MYIQSYQIHNVLNVYRKQLEQGKQEKSHGALNTPHQKSHHVSISPEGKRQSIINKVAENVIKKITTLGPESEFKQEMEHQLNNVDENPRNSEFVFNTIDKNNNKITNSFSIKNSDTLLKHFEQVSKMKK